MQTISFLKLYSQISAMIIFVWMEQAEKSSSIKLGEKSQFIKFGFCYLAKLPNCLLSRRVSMAHSEPDPPKM